MNNATTGPIFASTSQHDGDSFPVWYADRKHLSSNLRVLAFADRGKLEKGTDGAITFYGRKRTLKLTDPLSVRLVRPPFAYIRFLLISGLMIGYFFLFVLPSQDTFQIWFMAIVIALCIILLIRVLTVKWLEVSEETEGSEASTHYFSSGEKLGWASIFGGNAFLRDYFN